MVPIIPIMSNLVNTDIRAFSDSALDSEVVKRDTTGHQSNLIRSIFSSGSADPLEIIDDILSKYTNDEQVRADILAKEIEKRAHAIAEIDRLWGLVMQENLSWTNPSDNDQKTPLGDSSTRTHLEEIQALIANDLNDPRGIAAITGRDLQASITYSVNYNELQALSSTMTAFCKLGQADIDSKQQEFKNNMTNITSALEEIRDIRRYIVALTKW
ncbi:hypothetical protein IG557_14285 [Vibrio cholerae]|uniref:hypothetical protein n=1 Tax=Vibrio cholerae TaxID=666 RepID=UPI00226DCFFF|nr:hypothetical protein [Vibrio cholerae]MCX9560033.1 hypothetical protein [Vibrio cholerae]MCX9561052.1 hypothetical protein [Vibrio cholerae]